MVTAPREEQSLESPKRDGWFAAEQKALGGCGTIMTRHTLRILDSTALPTVLSTTASDPLCHWPFCRYVGEVNLLRPAQVPIYEIAVIRPLEVHC